MSGSSTKPYLLRAIHEWCADNGFTPYLAVAVDERTEVPREHVREGEIVLNISVSATNKLALGNERIEFQARFGGVARSISVPIENVTAIYARETGHGMAFDVPKAMAITTPAFDGTKDSSQDDVEVKSSAPGLAPVKAPVLSAVPSAQTPAPSELPLDQTPSEASVSVQDVVPEPEPPAPPPTPGGRPKLTVIK
jgi:stringent starvation protein B